MKRLRSKLTFSNVVAVMALFVALGGASYAATQLPKNSVGTKQLKKGSVTAAKVKKGTLTGTQIKSSTLGTVPNAVQATTADNAKALGGIASAGFLGADHLITGKVISGGGDAAILSDPRTGLTISLHGIGIRLTNTSGSRIYVAGIGFYGGQSPQNVNRELKAGATTDVVYEATGVSYLSFQAIRQGNGFPSTSFSCIRNIGAENNSEYACIAVG